MYFLTVIYQLLVTNKARSVFPSANHCQGQLKTPQFLTLHMQLLATLLCTLLYGDVNKWDYITRMGRKIPEG
jgi:hypothetical protein